MVALGNLPPDGFGDSMFMVDQGKVMSRVACNMKVPQRIDTKPDNSEQICSVVCGSCDNTAKLSNSRHVVTLARADDRLKTLNRISMGSPGT